MYVVSVGLLVTACTLLLRVQASNEYAGHFTNDFAVRVEGGQDVAERVASEHGFRVVRHISELDVYQFEHESVERRSKRSADEHSNRLSNDPRVKLVQQQKILHREKRATLPEHRDKRYVVYDKQLESLLDMKHRDMLDATYAKQTENHVTREEIEREHGVSFDDPMFPRMWYLINKDQTGAGPEYIGMDVNVAPVWKKGITGKDVVVCILDDGVDHEHLDLKRNYDPRASGDINDEDSDPMPEGAGDINSHGTKCAGEVAGAADNGVCGIGIAFNAKIGGVRMLDGAITDLKESRALVFQLAHIDIYSASWGPNDDGKTLEGPGKLAHDALQHGAENGRGGKGVLYIWATGNGGANGDDCNCDGYVSSIYSISIGCIGDHGTSTYFSEVCPSTMAVIFTGGSHIQPGERDYADPPIKVISTDFSTSNHGADDMCTDSFQGTSAAAPLAAGAFALVLEANPDLTWRDVQNIIVETARISNPKEPGWICNGAGYHLNHHFGFGALDCNMMDEAARDWNHVPEQHTCEVPQDNHHIDLIPGGTVNQTLDTTGCKGEDNQIDRMEHTQVHVSLKHPCRGALSIVLYSARGMPSEILSERPNDDTSDGLQDWTFMTVHNWGENPEGTWTLSITDLSTNDDWPECNTDGDGEMELQDWSITLWGTEGPNVNSHVKKNHALCTPDESSESTSNEHGHKHKSADTVGDDKAHVADQDEVQSIMSTEKKDSDKLEGSDTTKNGKMYKELVDILKDDQYGYNSKREMLTTLLKAKQVDEDIVPLQREKLGKHLHLHEKKQLVEEHEEEITNAELERLVGALEKRLQVIDKKRADDAEATRKKERKIELQRENQELEKREYHRFLNKLEKVLDSLDLD